MNSLVLALLASGCAAMSSFFYRRNMGNVSSNYNPSGYLLLFGLFCFLMSIVCFPETWKWNVNFLMFSIGACVGIFSSILMLLSFSALKYGPAGITYAFLNASAVFPGILLFIIFGSDWGYSCTYLQICGIILVLFGLFLGAKTSSDSSSHVSFKWLKYAIGCFVFQIFALTFIQGRCILFQEDIFPQISKADDIWFMPGQFAATTLIQLILFLREKRGFLKTEVVNGCLAGVANFSSSVLLLFATKIARPIEQGILFPCFAVGTLVLCNVWANRIYKEKFNFATNALCSLGIFLAMAS